MKPAFVAAILVLGILPMRAEESLKPVATPTVSTAPVTDPALLEDHFHQVLARPEFKDIAEPDTSSRVGEWISQWFSRLASKFNQLKYTSDMPAFASLLMTILSLLSLGGLVYIIVRLGRRRKKMEMEPSEETPGQKTFRPPEFYELEIQKAIQVGDWNDAWLAAWRQFLSRLENRRLVESDRTRTNREYLAQLNARPLPASAQTLLNGMVDAYDRYIYGHQFIGEPEWIAFRHQIEEAGLLLHLDDKNAVSRIKKEAT